MAFAAGTNWDVRTTGSDSNGGGFNSAATGTDRSLGDTPYISFTDLVIDAVTNTKITSATYPFDSTSPGNVIYLPGGGGFTQQRVQVVSVTGGVATCDKAVGTVGSTNGVGYLGGSLLTPQAAATLCVTWNIVHVKAGTYTLTASLTINNVVHRWVGYQTSHGDYGTKPLITTATDSVDLVSIAGNAGLNLYNLSLSNTAGTRAIGIKSATNTTPLHLIGCILDGFSEALDGNNRTFYLNMFGCDVKNCTGNDALTNNHNTLISHCRFQNNTTNGLAIYAAGVPVSIIRCLITDNGGLGAYIYGSPYIFVGNTVANNAVGGVVDHSADNSIFSMANNIFYGNGDWGFSVDRAISFSGWAAFNNAFGANTRGSYGRTGLATALTPVYNAGDVSLTEDPFTDSANGDYSLNNAAGGGALCKGAGYEIP